MDGRNTVNLIFSSWLLNGKRSFEARWPYIIESRLGNFVMGLKTCRWAIQGKLSPCKSQHTSSFSIAQASSSVVIVWSFGCKPLSESTQSVSHRSTKHIDQRSILRQRVLDHDWLQWTKLLNSWINSKFSHFLWRKDGFVFREIHSRSTCSASS